MQWRDVIVRCMLANTPRGRYFKEKLVISLFSRKKHARLRAQHKIIYLSFIHGVPYCLKLHNCIMIKSAVVGKPVSFRRAWRATGRVSVELTAVMGGCHTARQGRPSPGARIKAAGGSRRAYLGLQIFSPKGPNIFRPYGHPRL